MEPEICRRVFLLYFYIRWGDGYGEQQEVFGEQTGNSDGDYNCSGILFFCRLQA